MQLGIIGLGRMGGNIARRLMLNGHTTVVFDRNTDFVSALEQEGATAVADLPALVAGLAKPRAVWVMLPSGAPTEDTIETLSELLDADDIIIDGGNTYYRDDLRRAASLRELGVHYLDVGTSGGVAGEARGYCLMIGGEDGAVQHLTPIFSALAPGSGSVPRTPGRSGTVAPSEQGYLHCGPSGAGHFVKMVHNGIEYGLMAAYAEGFNILHKANIGLREQRHDAETTPLREPEFYRYELNLPDIAEVWRRGSVIGSWLLDLTAAALAVDPALAGFEGRVSDSGEGRWTIQAAIDEAVPTPVLSAALYERFASRGHAGFANQLLSVMRHAFGGHIEKPAEDTR